MAEEKKKIEEQPAAEAMTAEAQAQQPAEGAAAPEARPNRDRYSSMFSEDNPDVDFEDKEARYGRMAEERESYRNLRNSGRNLSQQLDKHRWMAAMFQDLADNPELNPLVWFAQNGIDVKAALDDPQVMEEVGEKFKNWQQKQVQGQQAEEAKEANIDNSLDALTAVQQEYGLSQEQFNRMWNHFWDEVFAPAFQGEVSKDTWVALMHSMNYDSDMANAREEAAMQARNEKHANKVKTFEEQQVPPSFAQGAAARPSKKEEKPQGLRDLVKKYM